MSNYDRHRRMWAEAEARRREAEGSGAQSYVGYDGQQMVWDAEDGGWVPEGSTPESREERRRQSEREAERFDALVAEENDSTRFSALGDLLLAKGQYGTAGEQSRTDATLWNLEDDMPTAAQQTPKYSELPDSEVAGTYADPVYTEAMEGALRQMEEWGGGQMTAADLANRDLTRRRFNQEERGNREAIMRGAQERGIGGSGLELSSLLGSQQAMGDRMSAQDAALQVAVQDRALRAMESAGSMASQGRGQSFDEERQRREAVDRFNAGNVDIRNRQEDARVRGVQDEYQNREDNAAMRLGQYNRDADVARQQRDRMLATLGAGADLLTNAFDDEDD